MKDPTQLGVRLLATTKVPTRWGQFICHAFESFGPEKSAQEHIALVLGEVAGSDEVLVRVHSECLTGDVFGSWRCDCGAQLHAALDAIQANASGVLVYLRGHEGRGIGLGHKVQAYALQDKGRDTVEANLDLGFPVDARTYVMGAAILVELGVQRVALMTNNPAKVNELKAFGLEIACRVPLETTPRLENLAYLRTKQQRLGHQLDSALLDEVNQLSDNGLATVEFGVE